MTHTSRSRTRSALRDQRGISLIETLVALALFALTSASLADFLVHQIRQASSNHLDTLAYSLAADAMELARAGRFADIVGESRTATAEGMTFTVTMAVDDNTPESGLKTITSNVSWDEPGGSRTISVSTIYTEVEGV